MSDFPNLLAYFDQLYGYVTARTIIYELQKTWPQINDRTQLVKVKEAQPYIQMAFAPEGSNSSYAEESLKKGIGSFLWRFFGKAFSKDNWYHRGVETKFYAPNYYTETIELKPFGINGYDEWNGYYPLTRFLVGYHPRTDTLYFHRYIV